ncbi:hypothetical protein MXB_1320, partial [Myxobolus squamalis]
MNYMRLEDTPQNEHIELSIKRKGVRWDKPEIERKKEARTFKKISQKAQKLKGIKAKFFNRQRRVEKVVMKKTIKAHEKKMVKTPDKNVDTSTAIPAYLLDRDNSNRSKILSNMIKQKRKEKAVTFYLYYPQGKWSVPIPKVRSVGEDEAFKVILSGKRK